MHVVLSSYHFYRTWKSIQVGGDFEVIIWGQATKGWDNFYDGVDPSRHHVKILIWKLEEG